MADPAETPKTEWTMHEIAPTGQWVYLPGDENGMLSINPDTVVDDMMQGYVDFFTPYSATPPNGEDIRREVELTAPWMIHFNHKVPNEFQLTNNIYHRLNRGDALSDAELEALAFHPFGHGEPRDIIAKKYLLWPILFGKMWELEGRDLVTGRMMLTSQDRLLKKKKIDNTRYGQWLQVHMQRILDGDEVVELTPEEQELAKVAA